MFCEIVGLLSRLQHSKEVRFSYFRTIKYVDMVILAGSYA